MNDLQIETTRRGNFLNLVIWDEDSGFIHTCWTLGELYGSELGFLRGMPGGRFRAYHPDIRTHKVTLSLADVNGARDRSKSLFSTVVEWIAENAEGDWSMDFRDHEPTLMHGPGYVCCEADFNLYFECPDDALLCMLKFK